MAEKTWQEEIEEAARKAAEKAKELGRQGSNAVVGGVAGATGVGMSANDEKIVKKAGLSGGDITYFNQEVKNNPNLKGIFTNLEGKLAN